MRDSRSFPDPSSHSVTVHRVPRWWIDVAISLGVGAALTVAGFVVSGPVTRGDRVEAGGFVSRLLGEWSAFEGWNQRSINFIEGGPRDALAPSTLAVGIWVVTAMLLHLGLVISRRRCIQVAPFAVIFLVGWVALDLRWQINLWRQLRLTHARFAGKSGEAKRMAAPDHALFEFAGDVKRQLDAAPARVFLLSQDLFGDMYYRRVRTSYFLLPHNVSSLWTAVPSAGESRPGDYVLVLRPYAGVSYERDRRVLRTGDSPGLSADLLLDQHEGLLFRVR